MRSMSLEKSRQREVELAQEIERLQMEIKTLQKNSEEAANVNQQLSKEVNTRAFCNQERVIMVRVRYLKQCGLKQNR